jgi:hypothetical protein
MKVAAGLVRPNLPPAPALRDDPHGFSRSGMGGHLWSPLALADGVGWVVGAPPPPLSQGSGGHLRAGGVPARSGGGSTPRRS